MSFPDYPPPLITPAFKGPGNGFIVVSVDSQGRQNIVRGKLLSRSDAEKLMAACIQLRDASRGTGIYGLFEVPRPTGD